MKKKTKRSPRSTKSSNPRKPRRYAVEEKLKHLQREIEKLAIESIRQDIARLTKDLETLKSAPPREVHHHWGSYYRPWPYYQIQQPSGLQWRWPYYFIPNDYTTGTITTNTNPLTGGPTTTATASAHALTSYTTGSSSFGPSLFPPVSDPSPLDSQDPPDDPAGCPVPAN